MRYLRVGDLLIDRFNRRVIFRNRVIQVTPTEYERKFNNPYHAAAAGFFDDVIEPRETRARVIAALDALRNKSVAPPPRRHGNMPV